MRRSTPPVPQHILVASPSYDARAGEEEVPGSVVAGVRYAFAQEGQGVSATAQCHSQLARSGVDPALGAASLEPRLPSGSCTRTRSCSGGRQWDQDGP